MIAVANKVIHNGGHKTKTGPVDEALFHWVSWVSGARDGESLSLRQLPDREDKPSK
jgi:hypothetical protein